MKYDKKLRMETKNICKFDHVLYNNSTCCNCLIINLEKEK